MDMACYIVSVKYSHFVGEGFLLWYNLYSLFFINCYKRDLPHPICSVTFVLLFFPSNYDSQWSFYGVLPNEHVHRKQNVIYDLMKYELQKHYAKYTLYCSNSFTKQVSKSSVNSVKIAG